MATTINSLQICRLIKFFLFVLLLCNASPAYGQIKTLDDEIAELLKLDHPEWKVRDSDKPPMTVPGGIGGRPTIFGEWVDGKRTLHIDVTINDRPEDEFRWFFMRQIIPPSRQLSGIGQKAWLVETGSSAEIGFAKDNLFFHLSYYFPHGPGKTRSIYVETAPAEEVTKALRIAQSLDKAIRGKRTLTPCRNDFFNPTFPRAGTNAEKFVAASLIGETETVKSLLTIGVPTTVTDKDGNTPLHLAMQNGCIDTVKVLIDAKADLNARNSRNQTALMIAANLRRFEVVRLLLAAGADVKAKDQYGNTAAFYVLSPQLFFTQFNELYTREAVRAMLKVLIDGGLDINERNAINGDTVFTAHASDSDEIWADLLDLSSNINSTDRSGRTMLIKLVYGPPPDEERLKKVKFLIAHGADISIKDASGRSAIDYLKLDREQRSNTPEWVQNIDTTIKLLEGAQQEKIPRSQ
jgi:ankyrin repeat protein